MQCRILRVQLQCSVQHSKCYLLHAVPLQQGQPVLPLAVGGTVTGAPVQQHDHVLAPRSGGGGLGRELLLHDHLQLEDQEAREIVLTWSWKMVSWKRVGSSAGVKPPVRSTVAVSWMLGYSRSALIYIAESLSKHFPLYWEILRSNIDQSYGSFFLTLSH